MIAPTGTIILWKSEIIPEGWSIWAEANGKFVMGIPATQPPGTGGSSTHTHSAGGAVSGGGHSHDSIVFNYGYDGNPSAVADDVPEQSSEFAVWHYHTSSFTLGSGGVHTHTPASANTGSANNMPPYKTARYIIKD
jgi:hypothetical protein